MKVRLDSRRRVAVIDSVDEKAYRGSRPCRLLGNPVIYQLVLLLEEGGGETQG